MGTQLTNGAREGGGGGGPSKKKTGMLFGGRWGPLTGGEKDYALAGLRPGGERFSKGGGSQLGRLFRNRGGGGKIYRAWKARGLKNKRCRIIGAGAAGSGGKKKGHSTISTSLVYYGRQREGNNKGLMRRGWGLWVGGTRK